jgi:hypothetical protein
MWLSLSRQWGSFLLSFSHLGILFIGVKANTALVWSISLAVVSVISLFFWIGSSRRYRQISDTPTSLLPRRAMSKYSGAPKHTPVQRYVALIDLSLVFGTAF